MLGVVTLYMLAGHWVPRKRIPWLVWRCRRLLVGGLPWPWCVPLTRAKFCRLSWLKASRAAVHGPCTSWAVMSDPHKCPCHRGQLRGALRTSPSGTCSSWGTLTAATSTLCFWDAQMTRGKKSGTL